MTGKATIYQSYKKVVWDPDPECSAYSIEHKLSESLLISSRPDPFQDRGATIDNAYVDVASHGPSRP